MDKLIGLTEALNYGLYLRGLVITLFAIMLFRANSSRLYGNHSPLDFIIYIILGAILGEAIVNNMPLMPSILVCILIVFIHRLLSYLSFKSHRIGKFFKGDKITLIKDGKYLEKNLGHCQLSHHDISQALRCQLNRNEIDTVKEATLERSGQISFILKD